MTVPPAEDPQTTAMAHDFLLAVGALAGAIALEQVLRALLHGDAASAERAIPWSVLGDKFSPTERLLTALERGGRLAAADLSRQAGIQVSFGLHNPYAQHWAEQQSATLVRQVTDETRLAIRQLIVRGIADGLGPDPVARHIRERIGLTQLGEQAVANYEAFLRDLVGEDLANLSTAVLERLARGGLQDRQLARLAREGMTADRQARLSAGYRRTLLRERSVTIARTELLRASSEGQAELWRQAIAAGQIDPGVWMREWLTAHDERTCPICAPLNGARAQINGWFPGGHERPPAHVQCRCTVGLVRRAA